MTWLAVKAFLKSPFALWIGVALLVIAGLAFAYNKGGEARGKKDQSKIERVESDLRICRENTGKLQGAIDAQNKAAEALRAQSEARIASANQAVSEAKKSTTKAEAQSAYIRAHPPTGVDVCVRTQDAWENFQKALSQ